MKKLIISNNSLLKPLYENIDNFKDLSYLLLSDLACIAAIEKNNFDMALVSPLVYSMIFNKQDYRIIPDRMLIVEDYSNLITINFKNKLKDFKTIFFEEVNEYIIATTKLLLSERFGLIPTLASDKNNSDLIVTSGKKIGDSIDIDFSEDWYDTFEIPFIAGFWIVNQENYPQNSIEIINSIIKKDLPQNEPVVERNADEQFPRHGRKYWTWKEEYRGAFEEIFDMLYYHNYAPHITDLKILNENYNPLDENYE